MKVPKSAFHTVSLGVQLRTVRSPFTQSLLSLYSSWASYVPAKKEEEVDNEPGRASDRHCRPGRVRARDGGYSSWLKPPRRTRRRWHAVHIQEIFAGGVGRRASHKPGALVVGCVRALGNATKLRLRSVAGSS
jgi:hypothetical protein